MKPAKAPVSRRAVLQRVNRKLAKDGLTLKVSTGGQAQIEVGQYFVLDVKRGAVIERHIKLEQFAKKSGVLADWERMED